LIIDHHEAEDSKFACVINNQICDYPTKSLSGVGMVYKFCSYIDELLNVNYANEIIDLVALGMIADVMSLRDFETRHLVVSGLKKIRNSFFKGMIEKQAFQLKNEITPFGIAFYIAPYVNATVRMGTQDEKLLLFESMLDYQGNESIPSTKRGCKGQYETKVEQACRNCSNIKNRQTKARDTSLKIIEEIIEEKNLLNNKLLVVKLNQELKINKNLTGLIANILMSKYQKPVLLLNETILDGEIAWAGSGRGNESSNLSNFRSFLSETGLVQYAEGHAAAFGTCILDVDFNEFIRYTNEALKDFDFTPSYKVDFIFDSDNDISNEILEIAGLKSIWGQDVEEPLIAIENIKISKNNIKLMSPDKNPTLKISLPNGLDMIKFGSSNEEFEKLYSDLGCVVINVVGRCEQNVWNGNINPQIIIEDYSIVGKAQYYF
jgi:single-stranded-DNA-specific exonuclease